MTRQALAVNKSSSTLNSYRPVWCAQVERWTANVKILGKRIGLGNGTAADVARFLRGPDRRRRELRQAASVFRELIGGFRALHFVGPCVSAAPRCHLPQRAVR